MNNTINRIEHLLDEIKNNNISWTSLEYFKKYLKSFNMSLRDVDIFQLYALYLQENKFLFDCSDTYFSISDKNLYIFSKNLSEFEFRLDVFDISQTNGGWTHLDAPLNLLLRFKNAITLTKDDTDEICKNTLDSLNS